MNKTNKITLASFIMLLSLCAGCPAGAPSDPVTGTPRPTARTAGVDDQAAVLLDIAGLPDDFLSESERTTLVSLVGDQPCPCPELKGGLAACAQEKGCLRAPYAVRSAARLIKLGEDAEEAAEDLIERFIPRDPETIDLKGIPCRGPKDALVTMVIYSDFECPHCGRAARLLQKLESESSTKLRVCYKTWPLTRIHPLAAQAARAAMAAHRQGRFWAMHDTLYANRDALERDDLLGYAKELGLDLDRFTADLEADEVKALVASCSADAKRLKLRGTPTFIINGRRMTDPKAPPIFWDWFEEAEALAKKKLNKTN